MINENKNFWIGVITILVVVLVVGFFKGAKNNGGKISEAAATSNEVLAANSYEIKKGDSLWKIAEETYKDGYKWTEIYEKNKDQIKNPNKLEIGAKIVLPTIQNSEIKSYTVVKGDNLWKISLSQCGSGFNWINIAKSNNLVNPRIIHPGNVLKIVCK